MNSRDDGFYPLAYERGTMAEPLPLWGNSHANPLELSLQLGKNVERVSIDAVPGAFQLLNMLSAKECMAFIRAVESLGFNEDAAVSLGRDIRHNTNVNWLIDDETQAILWQRAKAPFACDDQHFLGKTPLGLNQRMRFYRYQTGDFFKMHTDGAWPGSRVVDHRPVTDAFGDRYSLYTFLLFLSEGYGGGETQFLIPRNQTQTGQAQYIDVKTPQGAALCFPHGTHPLHCLHSSRAITHGVKYIIRSDVLFSL